MAGPVVYSTNPWYSLEVADKYRGGNHFAWICEHFDPEQEAVLTAGSLVAPSSNPRKIYEELLSEFNAQEGHSSVISRHKRTFRRLAKIWFAEGSIDQAQHDEIVASVNAHSWKIWKPVLYVIPKAGINPSRIISVPRKDRAGYGPELQIPDLRREEFDLIDLSSFRPSR
jgi:hypothetical protein